MGCDGSGTHNDNGRCTFNVEEMMVNKVFVWLQVKNAFGEAIPEINGKLILPEGSESWKGYPIEYGTLFNVLQ